MTSFSWKGPFMYTVYLFDWLLLRKTYQFILVCELTRLNILIFILFLRIVRINKIEDFNIYLVIENRNEKDRDKYIYVKRRKLRKIFWHALG